MVTSDSLAERINYENKIILAPMVRIGRLPTRLLALRHGADIVYSEEIIDWKLLKTYRQVNETLGTVDFIDRYDGTVVFRTCALERGKVVLQLGTASAERAFKVTQMIENDVAAIDINMGCPKEFSIKGGMGAALLADAPRAKEILKTLVDNVKVPITCKIRLFNDVEETIALVKEFESLGISAIGIHGRRRHERPQHACDAAAIKKVAQSIRIPVIANGGSKEIERFGDILKFKEQCGASSVMVARAAEWNVTIFRRDGESLQRRFIKTTKLVFESTLRSPAAGRCHNGVPETVRRLRQRVDQLEILRSNDAARAARDSEGQAILGHTNSRRDLVGNVIPSTISHRLHTNFSFQRYLELGTILPQKAARISREGNALPSLVHSWKSVENGVLGLGGFGA